MSKKPKPRESHRGLIVSSIFVSVAFHAVLLYFLWNNPFGFDSSYSPPLGFRKNHESIESGTQNHDMIREALDDMVITQSDENHLPLITEIVDEPETITILKNHDAEKSSNLLPQKMQFYTNMALLRSLEDEKGPLPIVEKQHLAIEQVKLLARPETPVDFSHLHKTNYHPKAASDSLAEDIQQIANRDNHFDLNIDKNTLPLAVSAVKHEDALIFDVNPQAEISYTATTLPYPKTNDHEHAGQMPQELINHAFARIETFDRVTIGPSDLHINYNRYPEPENTPPLALHENICDLTPQTKQSKTLSFTSPKLSETKNFEGEKCVTDKPTLAHTQVNALTEKAFAGRPLQQASTCDTKLSETTTTIHSKEKNFPPSSSGVTDYSSLEEMELESSQIDIATHSNPNETAECEYSESITTPKHLGMQQGFMPVDELKGRTVRTPKVYPDEKKTNDRLASREKENLEQLPPSTVVILSNSDHKQQPSHTPFRQYDKREMLGELAIADETQPEKNQLPIELNGVATEAWKRRPAMNPERLSQYGEGALCIKSHSHREQSSHMQENLDYNFSDNALAMTDKASSTQNNLRSNSAQAPGINEIIKDLSPNASHFNRSKRQTRHNLSELPTLAQLDTLSLQDDFYTKVSMGPMRNDGTRLFSIELHPRDAERLETIPQNYTFLIDRSGSIEKHRFKSFCDGVIKSLAYLKEGDTFNILLFDNGITKMSNHSLYATSSSIKTAKRFLAAQEKGFRFSTPNVYGLLVKMGEVAGSSPMYNTAFLLTNGKSLEHISSRDKNFKTFFQNYRGGFSLFTAAAGQGNNNTILEFVSKMSKGRHLHSQTHAGFPRKFAALVKSSKRVVASHIHATVSKAPDEAEIVLFPKENYMPNLCIHKPLVICGQVKKPQDFEMILQGRAGSEWINIRLPISLSKAEKPERSIEKDFALFRALNQFDNYLEEGKIAHLEEAQDLIQSVQ